MERLVFCGEKGSIANQCPITGGRGVYAARSLYESIEPTIYDDEAICTAIGVSQKSDMQYAIEKYFAIAPNPTDGDISFVAKQTCEEATQVEIYNALGQQLATTMLPAYESVTTISLTCLNIGIYFVQFKQNNVILQTEKLSIIH